MLNNGDGLGLYCKKRLSFYVEKVGMNNYDFRYGELVNMLLIGKKIFCLWGGKKKDGFLERDSI